MHDPILDQRLEHCRELLKAWQRFHLFVSECLKQDRDFTQEEENEFIKVKSQIAILFDSFIEAMTEKSREASATAQSILTVVENCILLRQVQRMSHAELKKMEIEWHEAYLLINTTIGALEDEQERLAGVSESAHRRKVFLSKVKRTTGKMAASRGLHFAIMALVGFLLFVGLPVLGVFNYDFMNQWGPTKKVYEVGRSLVQKTGIVTMAFKDWEKYEESHPIEASMGYTKREANESETARMVALNQRILADVTPIHSGAAVGKKNVKVVAFDKEGSAPVLVSYTLLDSSDEAQKVARDSHAVMSEAAKSDGFHYETKRHLNVIYLIAANSPAEALTVNGILPGY